MDWNELLADLESRFDAERRADITAQSADLAEAERGQVLLVDRLRGAVGRPVSLGTWSGRTVAGRLARVGEDVLLLEEGEGLQALVRLRAVATAGPLPGPAPEARCRRACLADALRGLARSGSRVRVLLVGSEVTGRVVRVGRDHVDLVVDGTPDRALRTAARASRDAVTVALGALEVVRSR